MVGYFFNLNQEKMEDLIVASSVNTCKCGKRMYKDRGSAVSSAVAQRNRKGKPLRAYICRYGNWHLSSKSAEQFIAKNTINEPIHTQPEEKRDSEKTI